MKRGTSRRQFLKHSAAAGFALGSASALTRAASFPWRGAEKNQLNIGIIGAGWRGADHVREFAAIPSARIIAVCDVDEQTLAEQSAHVPYAAKFVDFRQMLEQPQLDAVVVATPDHSHAVCCAAAMRAGKHVYCEKPLTKTVREARALADLAKETGLVTQLGIQIHAYDNYRRVVEIIQSGAIGAVREVHIWNSRSLVKPNPAETAPVPANLHYDLWLGPVSDRPFRPTYHPKWWRGWWAFGSGLLGDIFCHFADVAFWALDLQYPTRVSTEGPPPSEELCPDWTIAHFDFPARKTMPAVKLHWYDPPKKPEAIDSWKLDPKISEGVTFIGEDGMLFSNYGQHFLLPEERFKSYKPPKPRIKDSPGHGVEWVQACLKNNPALATAPFSYGGPLTEGALLGTVAFRAQKALDWDAANMRFPNAPDAQRLLDYEHRPGWTI